MTPELLQERENRLRRAFLENDFGEASDRLSNAAEAGIIENKEQFLKASAVAGWAGSQMNRPVNPTSPDWQGIKDGIARGYFKKKDAKNVTDDELFAQIAADYKAQDAAFEAAKDAAARGESWLGKFREKEASLSEMAGGRQTSYLGMTRQVHDAFRDKIAPYQATIASVAQKARSIQGPEGADYGSMADELIKIPKEDRPFVLEAISRQIAAKDETGAAQNLMINFDRGIERYLDAAVSGLERFGESQVGRFIRAAHGFDIQAQTPEEVEKRAQYLDLRDEMRGIATGKLSKLNDVRLLGMNLSGAARNAAMTLGAFVPYVGPAAMVSSFARETANEIRQQNPTMSRADAEQIAMVSAPFQAATEVISDRLLFGKLPNLKRVFTMPVFSAGGIAAQLATRVGVFTGIELAEELAQGTIPRVIQALKDDVPDVDWDGYFEYFKDQAPEMIAEILPMALLGAGVGQLSDYRAGHELIKNRDLLVAAKLTPEEADAIAGAAESGDFTKAESLLRTAWPKAAAQGQAPSEVRDNAVQSFLARSQSVRQEHERATAEAEAIGVAVIRDAEGWKVRLSDGSVIPADSAEAATRMQKDMAMAASEYEAETMVAAVDEMLAQQPGRRFEVTAEVAQAGENGLVFTNPITGQVREIKDEASLQNLRDEQMALAKNEGEEPAAALILGMNRFEFGNAIITVFQRGLNKDGTADVPRIITAMHEQIEASWRKGVVTGQFSEAESRAAVATLMSQLDVARLGKSATDQEKAWFERAATVARGEGDENLLREVISELAVRTWIGRDKVGEKTGLRPGTVLRALDAAVLKAKQPAEMSMMKRLRAWIKAVGAYLRGVVATAKLISQAEQAGTVTDYTEFMDKLLGLTESRREDMAQAEQIKQRMEEDGMASSLFPQQVKSDFFTTPGKFYRVIVGDEAFQDIVATGEVRTNAGSKVAEGATLAQKLAARPTAFPSFSKDSAAMSYAGENPNHYIVVSESPSIKPSTSGRHSPGKTFFPTDEQGNHLKSLPASEAVVYKHIGDGKYERVYVGGKINIVEGPAFSIAPTTAQDAEYMAAVRAGDMEKARSMVDEVAKNAGYDIRGYHGTRSPVGFTEFIPNEALGGAIFVAVDPAEAKVFGRVMQVFIKAKNVRKGIVRSYDEVRAISAAKARGQDAIRVTDGVGAPVNYAVFDSSQIKSANPVTYDESGNVIPLSQRFQTESADIRFSLSPTSSADQLAQIIESIMQSRPDLAFKIRQRSLAGIGRLIQNWSAERVTWKGDKVRPVVEKRTKASLDKEQAMREAVLEGEKIAAGMDAEQAKEKAKAEAAAWRQETEDMMADDWSPRESLQRDARLFNTAMAAFPAEIRAKIVPGGMVKLAGLATERARYKVIEKAMQKAVVELEKFMRKEITAEVDKLLERYSPQKDKSGRITGKLLADYTELIGYADFIKSASIEDQAKESDALEKAIENGESAEIVQDALNKIGVLRLFETWDTKDSIAQSAALDWINGIIAEGKLGKKILDEERKAFLDDLRGNATADILEGAEVSLTEANNITNAVQSSVWRKLVQNMRGMVNSMLLNTAQRLESIFGENSKVTDYFVPKLIEAANRSTDIKRDIDRKRRDALTVVFNTSSTLAHARGIARLQKPKQSGIFVTEGRKTEEVKLDIDTLTKLSDGTMTAEAAGLRQDQVDSALEEWASSDRKRTVTVEKVLNAGTQRELFTSEMKGIQWLLWSRQDASRAQMERDGWTDESFKQLDEFLSPEAKLLADWMASSYAEAPRLIDPVYRRLFNAPLPRVKNYAPIYRHRQGEANILDLDGSDVSSGLAAGFTKSRVNTVSPLMELDAMAVFLAHWENVAHWVSHAEVMRDARAVLLDSKTRTAIRQKKGDASLKNLQEDVTKIEGNGTDKARELVFLSGFWNNLMQYRAFKGLAWRISPVVKQASAVLNPLLADVPAHAYAIGLARAFTDPVGFSQNVAAMWKSDIIRRRVDGGFSAEARIAMQGQGMNSSMLLAMMQKGMMPMAEMDAGWTALGAAISFDYYRRSYIKENPGTTAELADAYASKQLDKMIATSAQPADLVNRALIERSSNRFMKALWMFASESRKTLAIEVMAIRRLATGRSKNKLLDLQRVAVAHVLQAAVTQLSTAILASMIGDDEDEEREWSQEQWASSLALGPIGGLFVFGRAIEMGVDRLLGLRVFRDSGMIDKAFDDVYRGVKNFDDLFSDDPDDVTAEIDRLSTATGAVLSGLFGPAGGAADVMGNIAREAKKVSDAVQRE